MGANFIAIEGMDGSGGTTQTRKLLERLWYPPESDPHRVVRSTKAPWPQSPYESAIRGILKQGVEGHQGTLLDLFLLDRISHWDDINGSLRDGIWVITDRWHYSTIVYQSITMGMSPHAIEGRALKVAPHADLTIVLDTPSEIASGRMSSRSQDEFEKNSVLQRRVRGAYTQMAEYHPDLVVVSGVGCAEDVHQRVWGAVSSRFPDV